MSGPTLPAMSMATKTNSVSVDEWMLWATAAGVAVTLILGIFSITFALLANGKAKRANAHADAANDIAKDANDIAKSARDDARAAATDARWSEALLALAPFINIDAVHDDMRPLFNRLRPALQMLLDRLRWDGFDQWVQAEMQQGLALMRELGEKPEPVTVNESLEAHRLAHAWAGAFNLNLRKFWLDGRDDAGLATLTRIAKERRDVVYQRNGWQEDEVPFKPLDQE